MVDREVCGQVAPPLQQNPEQGHLSVLGMHTLRFYLVKVLFLPRPADGVGIDWGWRVTTEGNTPGREKSMYNGPEVGRV